MASSLSNSSPPSFHHSTILHHLSPLTLFSIVSNQSLFSLSDFLSVANPKGTRSKFCPLSSQSFSCGVGGAGRRENDLNVGRGGGRGVEAWLRVEY